MLMRPCSREERESHLGGDPGVLGARLASGVAGLPWVGNFFLGSGLPL